MHIQKHLPVDTLIHGDYLLCKENCKWISLSHFKDTNPDMEINHEHSIMEKDTVQQPYGFQGLYPSVFSHTSNHIYDYLHPTIKPLTLHGTV